MRHIPAIRQLSTAAEGFRTILKNQLNDVHAAGTYKNERVISSPQKTVINIEGSTKSVVNFCANNYLGMSVSICDKKFAIRLLSAYIFKLKLLPIRRTMRKL